MKKAMISFYCAMLVTITHSTLAFASSNKEILRDLYDGATLPGSVLDFPEIDYWNGSTLESSKNTCVRVEQDDSAGWFPQISRVLRITPAAGPLIPEKREEKFLINIRCGSSVECGFDQTHPPTIIGKDLVVTNPNYDTWTDPQTGATHPVTATVFIRKSGRFVPFKMTVSYSSSYIPEKEYYGYCYPSGMNP